MTGETCRHCGGAIEYVEIALHWRGDAVIDPWWRHVEPPMQSHEAAPAFGGGS